MDLRQYDNASDFLAAVGGFLTEREAEHNLLLGIAGALARDPAAAPVFFAAIFERDAPTLAMLLTPPHRLVLSQPVEADRDGRRFSEYARAIVERLAPRWQPGGVLGAPGLARAVGEAWERETGQRATTGLREWIYRLDAVVRPSGVPGRLRAIEAADTDLLLGWMAGFVEEALHEASSPADHAPHLAARLEAVPPTAFVWDNEGPRSLAMATGPTPNGIRINWVYTPPDHRRHGYARAGVAALCDHLLAEGRTFCALFADADYPTSNFVYRSIGFRQIAEVQEVDFGTATPEAASPQSVE